MGSSEELRSCHYIQDVTLFQIERSTVAMALIAVKSESYQRRLPSKETDEQQNAYLFYQSLGNERSLPVVAQKFHKSIDTIKAWSAGFRWKERLQAKEREDQVEIWKEKSEALTGAKKKLVDILCHVVQDIDEDRLQVENIRDLRTLVETLSKLTGQELATKTEVNIEADSANTLIIRDD
jgi:hypothetical protein